MSPTCNAPDDKPTEEMQAKAKALFDLIKNHKPDNAVQIPLREITVALSAVALMVGKDPDTVDVEAVSIRAKELGVALFGSVGLDE